MLIRLSETKQFTDNFFDNVVVNDENQDIKNNRLELLKMFCNTFNNFINFSKLEGHLMKKVIFSFDDKSSKKLKNKKNILGGKGANLGEMGSLGLPVPPGFTISTKVCSIFYKNKKKLPNKIIKNIDEELKKLKKKLKRNLVI